MQSFYLFNDPSGAPYHDIVGPNNQLTQNGAVRDLTGTILTTASQSLQVNIPSYAGTNWCFATTLLFYGSNGVGGSYHPSVNVRYFGTSAFDYGQFFGNITIDNLGGNGNWSYLSNGPDCVNPFTLAHICVRNHNGTITNCINGNFVSSRGAPFSGYYFGGQVTLGGTSYRGVAANVAYTRFVAYSSTITDQQMIDDTTLPYDMFDVPDSPNLHSGQLRGS